MAAGLNIAALARRTGVPADTLRKWESRYGVLRPERTSGGQRRYTDVDIARVDWLRARLDEGYRIGEAAALLGGVDVETGRTPGEFRRALYDATVAGDADAIGTLLDRGFAVFSVEQMLLRVVTPALERVGDGWESGEISVAHEHLVSAAVRARLELRLADSRGDVRGVAVLACVPGERHELGLMMLGVLLRADGWQVAYLGADAPLKDAVALAGELDASLLALSATARSRVATLRPVETSRQLTVVLGGQAATATAARRLRAQFAGGNLRQAVRDVRRFAQ